MRILDVGEKDLIEMVEDEVDDLSTHYDIDGPHIERIDTGWDIDTNGGIHYIVDDEPITSRITLHSQFLDGWRESEKEIREESIRETGRHEAAHSLHYLHMEDQGRLDESDTVEDPRALDHSHLEAFATYEGRMAAGGDSERFGEFDSVAEIPEFWDLISKSEPGIEPNSGHGYGRMAADLIERSYLQNADLDEAQRRTRNTLINMTSHEELESHTRVACQNLGIPYFGDVVREERDNFEGYLEGEEYWEDPLADPDGGVSAIRLTEGEEAVNRALQNANYHLENGETTLEDFFTAKARVQVAEEMGFENEHYDQLRRNSRSKLSSHYQDVEIPKTVV